MNIYRGFRLGMQLAGFLLSNIAKTWIRFIIDHSFFLWYSVFFLQKRTLPKHEFIFILTVLCLLFTRELVRSMNYHAFIQVFMLNIISNVRCSWPDLTWPFHSIVINFSFKSFLSFCSDLWSCSFFSPYNLIFFSNLSFLPTLSYLPFSFPPNLCFSLHFDSYAFYQFPLLSVFPTKP